MNSRKVVFLFNSTLLIGTGFGFLMGFFLDFQTHINDLANFNFAGLTVVAITAAIWTVIAQMGFFAYLTIHRFGLGMFKSASLWNKVQIVLIAFALFDLMFFRWLVFADGESIVGYAVMPILLLIYSWIVAVIKSRETNYSAFVPTLFFMVVVTTIEWVPALTQNDMTFIINAIVPLLVANTWQILVLHRLHEQPNGKQPSTKADQERDRKITAATKQKKKGKKQKRAT
ncbi:KinB-signaling pathway activation protein [Bacillus daqingensis]|uniref:KinB-signaling pathway activation protein n=1 Tax=Bacillus daqingensis TaxID=872396 RepID=A0ABV9P1J1_9BACI